MPSRYNHTRVSKIEVVSNDLIARDVPTHDDKKNGLANKFDKENNDINEMRILRLSSLVF